MNYKRIFTFGCSFTNFHWPTWPYIIAKDLDIPLQNWGLCGLGNVGIVNRMIECDIKNKFNEDDLIIVLWSTWYREDRYLGSWTLSGNIFNDQQFYDKSFRKKYWTIENDIIKNSGAIISANKMFNINSQANITEMDDHIYLKSPLYQFYSTHLPKTVFPWDYTDSNKCKAYEGYLTVDNHPDIAAHLNYVNDFVYKDINLKLKQETIDYYMSLQHKIVKLGKNGEMKKMKYWGDMPDFFKEHLDWEMKAIGF